jgi:ribosomal protein S12 methylthiotransferase
MMDAIARLPHVCKYIDIPLQHASDAMLAAMRRNVTAGRQRDLIKELRARIPGMSIRTTFISGFPGETEDDHRRLMDFIAESNFEAVGVFEYSREEGTRAGTMEDDGSLRVPAEVKARRRHELMTLQQKLAFERAARIAGEFDESNPAGSGRRVDVLIDAPLASRGRATAGVDRVFGGAGRLYRGRTQSQAVDVDSVTYVQSREKLASGELIPCTIVGSNDYDLVARPTAELEKRVTLNVIR